MKTKQAMKSEGNGAHKEKCWGQLTVYILLQKCDNQTLKLRKPVTYVCDAAPNDLRFMYQWRGGAASQKHRSETLDNCRAENHLRYTRCTIRSGMVPGVLLILDEAFYHQEWDMKPTETRTRKSDRRIQSLERKEMAVSACFFAGVERVPLSAWQYRTTRWNGVNGTDTRGGRRAYGCGRP